MWSSPGRKIGENLPCSFSRCSPAISTLHADKSQAMFLPLLKPCCGLLWSIASCPQSPDWSRSLTLVLIRAALLKLEEDWIQETCAEIAKHKPDVVITEKGLSDLAMHYLSKANISAIRRLRKTDNNRIARATGAVIVHRSRS